jgi:hypothetical protein
LRCRPRSGSGTHRRELAGPLRQRGDSRPGRRAALARKRGKRRAPAVPAAVLPSDEPVHRAIAHAAIRVLTPGSACPVLFVEALCL